MAFPGPQVPDFHVAESCRPYGQQVAAGRQSQRSLPIAVTELPEEFAGGGVVNVNQASSTLKKGGPRFIRGKGPTMRGVKFVEGHLKQPFAGGEREHGICFLA